MKFEWDTTKAQTNQHKHGVTFEEARTVLADYLSVTIPDPLHPDTEQRFVTLGMSEKHCFLVVVHTDTETTVRIISARKATLQERRRYESRE